MSSIKKFYFHAFFLIATIILVAIPAYNAISYKQRAKVYNLKDGDGQSFIVEDIVEDLEDTFQMKIRSFCITGTWLFYLDVHFAGGPGKLYGTQYDFSTDNSCENIKFSPGEARSVRFAGCPFNYSRESFNLYEDLNFEGYWQRFFYSTKENITGIHRSVIITGSSNWTVTAENGTKTCLQVDGYEPLFVHDLRDVGIEYHSIVEVSRGCFH